MKCCECGKSIKNPHYINGKVYGYNCYKQKLAMIYKQFEDEKNVEYSKKCFSAMKVIQARTCKNRFIESVINQWDACHKLTMKQLNCILDGFTQKEYVEFYKDWFVLANDENKKSISRWLEIIISREYAWKLYVEDNEVLEIVAYDRILGKNGFHIFYDIDEPEKYFILRNGRKNYCLNDNRDDEYIVIVKVISGRQTSA